MDGREVGVVVASLDEVVSLAQSNMSAVNEARGSVESTKAKIDETQSQFAGLGADAKASEAAALQQVAEQAQAMFEPVKQKLEELVSQAQAMKSGTLAAGSSAPPMPTYTVDHTNKTVDVGQVDTRPITGDQVEPPKDGPEEPGSLRQELRNPDDHDTTKTRAQKATRAAARNVQSINDQVKDSTNAANFADVGEYDPSTGGRVQQIVGADSHQDNVEHQPLTAGQIDGITKLAVTLTIVGAAGAGTAARGLKGYQRREH